MMRYVYPLLLLSVILMEAADLKEKGRETQAKDLEKQLAEQTCLMNQVRECRDDTCDPLDKTMYMKKFLSQQETVKQLEKDLSELRQEKLQSTEAHSEATKETSVVIRLFVKR